MSDTAGLITAYKLYQVANWSGTSSTALWIYDWLSTLPTEISTIWSRKITGATLLFALNRYLFLIQLLLSASIGYSLTASNSTCQNVVTTQNAIALANTFTTEMILILRIYAIFMQAKWVIALFGSIGLARIVTGGIRNFAFSNSLNSGIFGCVQNLTNPTLYSRFNAADSSLLLGFDFLIFLLTIVKTISVVMESRRLKMEKGLSYYLLRDGTMYYVPVTAIAVVILCFTEIPTINPFAQTIIGAFFDVTQNILVNRLVLGLKDVGSRSSPNRSISTPSLQNIDFATNGILGNLGASVLAPGESFFDPDDEEGVDEIEMLGPEKVAEEPVSTDIDVVA